MTNEQVKAQWEASGRKARLEFLKSTDMWIPCRDVVLWDGPTTYRIHPDDVDMCKTNAQTEKTTAPKPHGKYDYARKMIDAIERDETTQGFHGGAWVNDSSPIYRSLSALNDPRMVRIKPKTVRRRLSVWRMSDGNYQIMDPVYTTGHGTLIKEIEVEEEQ